MPDRLRNDVAFQAARAILEPVEHMLTPSDQQEFFSIVYNGVSAAIDCYLLHSTREAKRLNPVPSDN